MTVPASHAVIGLAEFACLCRVSKLNWNFCYANTVVFVLKTTQVPSVLLGFWVWAWPPLLFKHWTFLYVRLVVFCHHLGLVWSCRVTRLDHMESLKAYENIYFCGEYFSVVIFTCSFSCLETCGSVGIRSGLSLSWSCWAESVRRGHVSIDNASFRRGPVHNCLFYCHTIRWHFSIWLFTVPVRTEVVVTALWAVWVHDTPPSARYTLPLCEMNLKHKLWKLCIIDI